MKSLIKYALLALAGYVVWDMFGRGWVVSLETAAGRAKDQLSDIVTTKSAVDFRLEYDGRTRRFTITTPGDGGQAEDVRPDMLAVHLKTSRALVPHVEVRYDASSFATSAAQAEFEENVRRQIEHAKGRASFVPKGRPQAY